MDEMSGVERFIVEVSRAEKFMVEEFLTDKLKSVNL